MYLIFYDKSNNYLLQEDKFNITFKVAKVYICILDKIISNILYYIIKIAMIYNLIKTLTNFKTIQLECL